MFIFAAAPADVNAIPVAALVSDDLASTIPSDADDFPVLTDDEWESMAEGAYANDRVCSGLAWL